MSHHLGELVPVLVSFSAAQVDAESQGIEGRRLMAIVGVVQTGSADGLDPGGHGKERLPRMVPPAVRILTDFGNAPILDFGGNLHWEPAGVKERQSAHA